MSASYSIRRAADADLDAIADYLGSRNFNTGLRFIERVRDECLFLAAYPGAGTLRRDAPRSLRGLRSWRVRSFPRYLIFYLPVESGIDIIRILHGARNIRRALRETES